MVIGRRMSTPVYTGYNYEEVKNSFPFYITRDDQDTIPDDNYYSITNSKGIASICSGECPETKSIHFFTNIGILSIEVGECIEFMDIE